MRPDLNNTAYLLQGITTPTSWLNENKFGNGGPVYNKSKKRWYNKGEQIPPGRGYWHNDIKKYVMYGSDGSITKYTPLEWAKKKNRDIRIRRKQLERKYSIPVNTRVTLSQSGNKKDTKDNGSRVSQQQVDSILKYANIVKVPRYDALGLAAQESTFSQPGGYRGNGYFYDKALNNNRWLPEYLPDKQDRVSPVLMTSDWSYIEDNPYNDFITTVEKIKDPRERRKKELEGRAYMDKQASKFKVDISPLQHSLELFKSGRYNSGDPGYNNKVRRRGSNLRNSPEMVKMVNSSPFFK